MNSLVDLWLERPDFLKNKAVHQIIKMAGNGKLKDEGVTSSEFRGLLRAISSALLASYATECLENPFDDSGMVLQDVVNEIGARMGFNVKHGLYTGRKNKIGFDGIWIGNDGHAIVIERRLRKVKWSCRKPTSPKQLVLPRKDFIPSISVKDAFRASKNT